MDEYAETCGYPILPFFAELFTADAANVYAIMCTGHGVEPSGVDYYVKLKFGARRPQAIPSDALKWGVAQIH